MQSNISSIETWAPLIALSLVLISWWMHKIKKTPHRMSLYETLSNVTIFVIWRYLFFAGGLALQFYIFNYISKLIPWKLPSSGWVFALSVLLADFSYYWKHRFEHQLNFLWCQHSVHHSSEEFNLSTSLRLPWLGSYLNWFFFVPIFLLGFSAPQVLLGHQVVLVYQYLIHTEFVQRVGILERILNTPSHHRVHHGRNEEYLDKNFGGILIIWDKLFSTFTPETKEPDYGLVHPLRSKNPILINLKPWKDLFDLAKSLPSFRSKIQLLFVAPAKTELFLKLNQK